MFLNKRSPLQHLHREVTRVFLMVLIGFALIHFSPELATTLGIPAFSPWGLFIGGLLIAVAVAHIARRLLFPKLDLQLIARRAIGDEFGRSGSMPAAVVFASLCAILGLLISLSASMLKL